jgi:ATP-dependent 26S proteasome regulatory subunit
MKEEFKNQLTTALLSAPIAYIPHFHYKFVDETLEEILCPKKGYKIFDLPLKDVLEYDCGMKCVVKFNTKKFDNDRPCYDDVKKLLNDIVNQNGFSQPVILLLKNFSAYLNDADIQSLLASFAYQYEKGEIEKASTIIIVSPMDAASLPKGIEKFITVVEIKAPHQEEIKKLLDKYEISKRYFGDKAEEVRMDLCRTLQGLQLYEIQQILYSALIRTGGNISAKTKQLALEEKKNIVKKSGIIEVVETNESFEQIGGLEILKDDLKRKAKIYRHLNEAQKNNVSLPKGILILGMPGCGKTMIAKAVANEFGVSLLRLDVNRLMGKYVGESETNLRNALTTAEAAHPCVLWIDEIEKAFAGTNGRHSDMLVMRLMGHFLTWMQERTTPVFIVATANDVMRPEFMRKGRFDEVYFVDFPNVEEREEILRKTMSQYQKNNKDYIFDFSDTIDLSTIVREMEGEYGGFSGAEIKSVVNMVIEKKFVEYIEQKDQNPEKPTSILISMKDFIDAIEVIKKSVMANQKSNEYLEYTHKDQDGYKKQKERKKQKNESEWTNIERIKYMQKRYNFKPATKKKTQESD